MPLKTGFIFTVYNAALLHVLISCRGQGALLGALCWHAVARSSQCAAQFRVNHCRELGPPRGYD